MKTNMIKFVLMLCVVWPAIMSGSEAAGEPEVLPDLVLTVPEDQQYNEYLGLTGEVGSSFSVQDIQADILLIELFDMYCQYCQREAPAINELYEMMQEISRDGPVVKIIGLGVSNSQFEVELFRDIYSIPFPLFPDKDMSSYRALAGEGTPGFIGCRLEEGEKPTIVLRKFGAFSDPGEFLNELIEKGSSSEGRRE